MSTEEGVEVVSMDCPQVWRVTEVKENPTNIKLLLVVWNHILTQIISTNVGIESTLNS